MNSSSITLPAPFRVFIITVCIKFLTISYGIGQVQDSKFDKISYHGFNAGFAKTYESYGYINFGLGLSFLWGETYIFKKKFILDWEIGLAIPTLATAKAGFGLLKDETSYTIGIRPYPSTCYFQIGFPPKEKGSWLISFEYNPRKEYTRFSGFSNWNINIGYRIDRQ